MWYWCTILSRESPAMRRLFAAESELQLRGTVNGECRGVCCLKELNGALHCALRGPLAEVSSSHSRITKPHRRDYTLFDFALLSSYISNTLILLVSSFGLCVSSSPPTTTTFDNATRERGNRAAVMCFTEKSAVGLILFSFHVYPRASGPPS